MSARKNGPIGSAPDSCTSLSTSSVVSPSSSWARHTSPIAEMAMRLPTKPGTSPQRIGILRMAWAKLAAACIVSGEVSSPSITSIRRIIEAG